MDTLSLVSKYLNGMEDLLDDGDSLEAKKLTIGKIVVFKKVPPRAYSKPFIRFSLLCDVDGQGAWDAELDMADSFNCITEEMFDQLGFVRVDYGKYGRKMVKESRVDFGIKEMHIDLTMLEEIKDIDVMLDSMVGIRRGVGRIQAYFEVLENYMTYQKKLDEVLMGRARLSSDDYVKVNGTVEMSALADTGASVSVLPYCIFKNLGLGDPKPYNSNLTMADNTQSKAMREVKNVRIQIGYQAYLVDFLILDIPVDKELPLLLGRPFLRTCGAVIDMGRVGRDEDGNLKYGPVAPSFLDIKDDMERALAMEAYFNPFKNIIVFKKLIDFLGSLSVQLKNTDWGNEGYGTYKKVEGDGAWHAKFEVTTPSGRKFTRVFKTKKTDMKLSEKFTSDDILKFD
ncbi:putative ribonuclease H-like domain-containing protein [Tanacetum coccineum]